MGEWKKILSEKSNGEIKITSTSASVEPAGDITFDLIADSNDVKITQNNGSAWNPTSSSSVATKAYVDSNSGTSLTAQNVIDIGNLTTANTTGCTGDQTIPSGNAIIDWTADQGATNIHAGNYTNTTYSEGNEGLVPGEGAANTFLKHDASFGIPEGANIASTGATNGYVLTANGADGCSWATVSAGTDVDVSVGNLETRLSEIDSNVTIGNADTVNTTISGDLEVGAQMMVKGSTSDSKLVINNTGIASIDTILEFQKGNASKFVIGFDDGDDTFKMNSGGNFVGTADFEMDTSGNLTIAGNVNGASATELGHLSGVTSSVSAAITKANDAMPKSGDAFTGVVTLAADPLVDLGAATKQYVDGFLIDEDDMSTDSATRLPSQQSVKAYVDANVVSGSGISTGKSIAMAMIFG